jgi:hypothetical protein
MLVVSSLSSGRSGEVDRSGLRGVEGGCKLLMGVMDGHGVVSEFF